jgi:hypothetical protein
MPPAHHRTDERGPLPQYKNCNGQNRWPLAEKKD